MAFESLTAPVTTEGAAVVLVKASSARTWNAFNDVRICVTGGSNTR